MDWFTISKHQSFLRVKGVGTHYQSTVHSLVQMLPWVFGSVLHSSIWWSNNIYVIKHDISCACAITLYKSITCVVDYIWDMEHSQFISWQKAQIVYGLLDTEARDRDLITWSVVHEWPHILERDRGMVRHDMWTRLFMNHLSDPDVVLNLKSYSILAIFVKPE